MLVVNFKMGVHMCDGGHKLSKILLGGDIPRQCSKSLVTTRAGPGPPEVSPGGPIPVLGSLWATHVLLCASVPSKTMDRAHRPGRCQALTLWLMEGGEVMVGGGGEASVQVI